MKKTLLLFAMLLAFALNVSAQEFNVNVFERKEANPVTDQKVVRKVALIDIEGTTYENVVVSMKSTSPDDLFKDKYKVRVVITDSKGKKIWKKTLKNVFLYVFPKGQVQIGKGGFDQIVIQKSSNTDDFIGKIREKEGVY